MILKTTGWYFFFFANFPKKIISELRRGEKCVHLKFGIDIALNAGNFLYYAPIVKLLNCPKYKNTEKMQ